MGDEQVMTVEAIHEVVSSMKDALKESEVSNGLVVSVEITDELISLLEKQAKLKAQLKPIEEAIKKIEEPIAEQLNETVGKGEKYTLHGSKKNVEFSAMGKSKEVVDVKEVAKALTVPVFLQVAKVTLTDMAKYLTQIQIDALTTEDYKSKRRTKVVSK